MKSFLISGHARLQVHRVLINSSPETLGDQIKAQKCADKIQLKCKQWPDFGVYKLTDVQKIEQGLLMNLGNTVMPIQVPILKVDPRKDHVVSFELPDDYAEWLAKFIGGPKLFQVSDSDWVGLLKDCLTINTETDLKERWSEVLAVRIEQLEEEEALKALTK